MDLSSVSATLPPLVAREPARGSDGPSAAFAHAAAEAGRRVGTQRSASSTQRVTPERTPLSGEQASQAIASAYTEATGRPPSKETLAILTSHWSLETGQGARMYNFNFAGLKGRSPEGLSAQLKTREGYGATEVHIRDGFRAYSSAEAGARDYVSLLSRRYSSALGAADGGDPAQFVRELKAGGYFTGDEALYSKGLIRLANRAMEYGTNAIGGSPGELASLPEVEGGRFEGARSPLESWRGPSAEAASWPSQARPFAMSAASVDSMADAVARAALSIAADPGRARSTSRSDRDGRG